MVVLIGKPSFKDIIPDLISVSPMFNPYSTNTEVSVLLEVSTLTSLALPFVVI
jgi:hypothetical protein